jgi:CRP-like cAMP-binding protein
MIDLANRIGTPAPNGVDIKINNEDLGALADVSRFTVSRTMARWQKRHVIEKNRNHVVLIAPEGIIPRTL